MWILLVILLSNPHHILIISSSYPHHILIISSCSIPSRPWTSSANAMVFMASAWRWKSWCPRRTGFSRGARPGEPPFLKWQFSEVVLAGCERFDMFHERCKHDISWCPWKIYLNFKQKHDSFLDISWCPWNLQAIFFPSKLDAAPCLFKFFLDNNLIALYMRDGFSREEVVWWRGIKTLWQLLWLKLQRIFIHGTLDLVVWYYV